MVAKKQRRQVLYLRAANPIHQVGVFKYLEACPLKAWY
jgi:hypothetical protein